MVKVTVTQVLTRKMNDETSYIACAKTKEGGQLVRFIGTGISPFSEYASYNVEYNDDSVMELHPNKVFVNSSTIIEQCENTSNLSKLIDARTAMNNDRLSTVKSVVVSCEEAEEVGGGKRRKLRVADDSVNKPMNVMAYDKAADKSWVAGDVIIFHRPKVYAPEGTDYRSISIYDEPTKSGNDKESDELQELYKAKFAEKEYKEVDSIAKLSTMSESLDYVQVDGILVKVDVLTPQQQEGREAGGKFLSMYVADTSGKYINCVSFDKSVNDSIVCDQTVKVKLSYNVNGKRKNFVVKQIEAIKNKELENWWSTMMWMDLLPVFETDATGETTVKDIATNCKNWSGEKKRVSVRGTLVRNDSGVTMREGDHEITIKEVNCELPESGANVLVENAPVNEFGIVVFANTKVTRCV